MEVRAAQIETPAGVEIVNPDHYIATLNEEGGLEVEMEVELGRGFRPAEENKREDAPLFLIPVDADFSPIERVKFGVEETRVGGRSGYERLALEIWTNGALRPQEAAQAAMEILGRHFSLLSEAKIEGVAAEPEEIPEELLVPLSELGIEPRAANLLREQGIVTLGDLLTRTREELLDIGGFGEKTLERVEARVRELGYLLRSERVKPSLEGTEPQTVPSAHEIDIPQASARGIKSDGPIPQAEAGEEEQGEASP
jgi:DNA-directed RNA polymerase subunit alpha